MTDKQALQKLGNAIRSYREKHSKNQHQASLVSPLSRGGIAKIESGVCNPRVLTLARHLEALGGIRLSTFLRRIGL